MKDRKKCTKCTKVFPLTEFGKTTRGHKAQCKSCVNAYQALPKTRETMRKYMNQRRAVLRQWLWTYLDDKQCIDCGESDSIVLEFDHVRGVKEQSVTRLVQWGATLERIQREIDKCEIRCANCHKRVTYKRAGSYRI